MLLFACGLAIADPAVMPQEGATSVDPASPGKDPAPSEDSGPALRYEQAVSELEETHGAYQNGLSEQLLSLGLDFQTQGHHEQALDAFKRAVHITRINEGLYTLGQVPIVERIIQSLVSSGHWGDANNQYDYLYWVHKRSYGASDPRLLPVIDQIVGWHLRAYSEGLGPKLYRRLLVAKELNDRAIQIVEESYGSDDPRLAEILHRLYISNYYLSTYAGEPRPEDAQVVVTVDGAAPNEPTPYERDMLIEYIGNSYRDGKHALERLNQLYAANGNAEPKEQARAKVWLGDWFLLFNKKRKAMSIYEEVYTGLAKDAVMSTELETFFGAPTPLPELESGKASERSGESTTAYVEVSFDVTPWGKAKNVAVLEATGARRERNRSRARGWLRETRFRPRFENGTPVLTQNVKRRFNFYDQHAKIANVSEH